MGQWFVFVVTPYCFVKVFLHSSCFVSINIVSVLFHGVKHRLGLKHKRCLHILTLNLRCAEWAFLSLCLSWPSPPFTTLFFFCTNLWQQQQLLRPSLLRPEVETLLLIHRDCSCTAAHPLRCCCSSSKEVLSDFSLCLSEMQELSMESGIDPGQDYYTQDYYNYDQGWAFRPLTISPLLNPALIQGSNLHQSTLS